VPTSIRFAAMFPPVELALSAAAVHEKRLPTEESNPAPVRRHAYALGGPARYTLDDRSSADVPENQATVLPWIEGGVDCTDEIRRARNQRGMLNLSTRVDVLLVLCRPKLRQQRSGMNIIGSKV